MHRRGLMRAEPRLDAPRIGEEEQRQVHVALHPRAMATYLTEGMREEGGGMRAATKAHPSSLRVGRAHATCYILDVKYEPGDYCTVLYRLDERLVIGKLRWGDQDVHADIPETARLIDDLGMQV